MKRSTLTLSILTALLVSACGGSSSNDEQTKDPTPPKVTPTNPSTPSTGRTPTTGNKDNAGTSAGSSAGTSAGSSASSSSSDPTPPISSGSAPSGGKPIVITSETKEKEKEKEKENKPQEDPLKALNEKIEAAKKALKASEEANGLAQGRLDDHLKSDGALKVAEIKAETTRKKFLHADLGLNDGDKENAGLVAIELALEAKKASLTSEKYNEWKKKIANYKRDLTLLKEQQDKVPALQADAKAKAEQFIEDQKNLADLEADKGLANAEGIKAEEDFYNAKKSTAALKYDFAKKEAKFNELDNAVKKAQEERKGLRDQKKDLGVAKEIEGLPSEKKEDIEKKIADLKTQIKAKNEEIEKLKGQKDEAESLKNTASKLLVNAKTKTEELAKALKYRAVLAADGGFSKDSFAVITKVENEGGKWTLTFEGSDYEIDPTDITTKIESKSGDSYGNFKKDNDKGLVAYQRSNQGTQGEKSIYGYIGDKFYSVGEVTKPEYFAKLENPLASYKGKALLQAKKETEKGLIAEFSTQVNFKSGDMTGNFYNFASYNRNADDKVTADPKLPDSLKDLPKAIEFNAKIKGSKFMTEKASDNEASVYGYFYGDEAQEAGGLVEYKDMFHGSFGGAKSK